MVKSSIQKPFRKRRTNKPLKKSGMVPTLALTRAVNNITMAQKEVKLNHINLLTAKTINGGGLTFQNFLFNAGAGVPNVLAGLGLTRGTFNNQRIGNDVNVKSVILKGFINQMPYNAHTNASKAPFDVYMIVYKRKAVSDGDPLYLKEYPNDNMGMIDGSITTTVLHPFNRQGYIIKKVKKFSFKAAAEIISGGQTTPPAILNPETGSSTRDYFKTFSVKVPVKKVLKFNDADTEPKNDWFTVGFYYINGDAGATLAGSTIETRAAVTLQGQLRFTDD